MVKAHMLLEWLHGILGCSPFSLTVQIQVKFLPFWKDIILLGLSPLFLKKKKKKTSSPCVYEMGLAPMCLRWNLTIAPISLELATVILKNHYFLCLSLPSARIIDRHHQFLLFLIEAKKGTYC